MSKKAEERDVNYKKVQELREKMEAGTATFAERNVVKIFDKRRRTAKRKDAELAKAAATSSSAAVGRLIHTGRLKRP